MAEIIKEYIGNDGEKVIVRKIKESTRFQKPKKVNSNYFERLNPKFQRVILMYVKLCLIISFILLIITLTELALILIK